MDYIYNLLPGWAWIGGLTILEIILRLTPTSKPYYTILGGLKHILDAIVPDNDVNTNIVFWTEINGRLSKKWPVITKRKAALPDAEEWNGKPNKLDLLEE